MSALIYWLAIRVYAVGIRVASLFHNKAKRFIAGRRKLLSNIRYALIDERRPCIWMHCASLGEFEQGRPVLEHLRRKHPNHAIVLTFFSPSGYEVRKGYDGADYVFYLPLDSLYNANKFLDIVNPKLAIFVKYELWYFFLSQTAKRDIPLLLISAVFRKYQPFFQWYGRLHRRMLHSFTRIFVQDVSSKQLLNKIGIDHVSIGGDTRFDRVLTSLSYTEKLHIADAFCENHKILVAGSTWREDEVFLKKVMKALPTEWRLILVPHEVDETHISEIERLFQSDAVLWSAWEGDTGKRILVVDRVGLLMQLYGYGTVAWVGGGFGKDGVHNVLEAAVHKLPVAFGPVYDKFIEAVELLEHNGAITTGDPNTLANYILQWNKDHYTYQQISNAAEKYVRSKAGATAIITGYIEEKNWLSVA